MIDRYPRPSFQTNIGDQSNSLYQSSGGPPPPGGSGSPNATTFNYLGPDGYQLPDTYTTPVSSYQDSDAFGSYTVHLATPVQMAPRYKQGDELYPPDRNYDPNAIAALQTQMVTAGLLKPGNFQLGSWNDKASMEAYRQLLGYSNVAGTPWQQTIQQMHSVIDQFGDTTATKGKIRQPFIATQTDPDQLRNLLGQVAGRIMGRALTPEEEANFISSYQAKEVAAQQAKYDAAGDIDPVTGAYTGAGGTVTAPEDPTAAAADYIRSTRPKDVVRHDVIDRFNQFQDLLAKYH